MNLFREVSVQKTAIVFRVMKRVQKTLITMFEKENFYEKKIISFRYCIHANG